MITSQFYFDEKKRESHEIWHEFVNGTYHFWDKNKSTGISSSLTKRIYVNTLKKYQLETWELNQL